jgi:hypothetical protein
MPRQGSLCRGPDKKKILQTAGSELFITQSCYMKVGGQALFSISLKWAVCHGQEKLCKNWSLLTGTGPLLQQFSWVRLVMGDQVVGRCSCHVSVLR